MSWKTQLQEFTGKKHRGVVQLSGAAIGLVVLGLIVAISSILIAQFQANVITPTISNSSTANTTLNNLLSGLGQFGSWFGIIVLVIVMGYLLSLVLNIFGGTGRR